MAKTSFAPLAIALTLVAGAAQAADAAATLSAVNGDVIVGGGAGFAVAKAGSAMRAGDRVVARNGRATLRYADGCTVSLAANGMATIAAKSPCAGGPGLVQADAGSSAQLGLPKWPVGAYFAGAGVAVIAGALIYGVAGGGDDDEPVSN